MQTNTTRILIVDDEAEIRSMLTIFLEVEGFEVVSAGSGTQALRTTIGATPALVLLDLGLPDLDGQEVISSIRRFSHVPIIVLSARDDDAQVTRALDAGAEDYVTKPFRADVLLARIRANLRQHLPRVGDAEAIANGPLTIDLVRHEVLIRGVVVPFTRKEFELLQVFMVNRGKMMTHRQILREVWGPSHMDDTQYLRVYVGQVRLKLEQAAELGGCIISESGIGYRMDRLEDDTSGRRMHAV